MKSKLYRFIHSELTAIETQYATEIDALKQENRRLKEADLEKSTEGSDLGILKEENQRLKDEIEAKNKRIEDYKAYFTKYQNDVSKKIMEWKTNDYRTEHNQDFKK